MTDNPKNDQTQTDEDQMEYTPADDSGSAGGQASTDTGVLEDTELTEEDTEMSELEDEE